MAVTYNATLKTARMQLVADLISGKVAAASTGTAAAGFLVIGDATLASPTTGVLAKLPLNATPGTVSGNVFTINASGVSAAATATGTASKAELWTSANAAVVQGLTVGTTGTDIIIASTAITSGQTVTLTSGTITHG